MSVTRVYRGTYGALLATMLASPFGCDGPSATVLSRRTASWSCPEGWVEYEHGGCGPEVLLCPDRNAAPSACPARDRRTQEESVEGSGFYLAADGTVGGGWSLRGERGAQGRSPCPARWRLDRDGACAPVDETCPEDAPSFGSGCLPVDAAACGAGDFAMVKVPAGVRVVHVLAAAAEGGDGTRERPFRALEAALQEVSGRGWVMLGAGRYPARVDLGGEVHLIGVCPARTTLVGADRATVLVTTGGRASLRGLAIEGGRPGVEVREGGSLEIERVVVDATRGYGVLAAGVGASVTARDLLVRGARAQVEVELPAAGVAATAGARVQIDRAVIQDNADWGVAVSDQAELHMVDSVIEGTAGRDLPWAARFVDCEGGEPDSPLGAFTSRSGSGVVAFRRGRLVSERLLLRNNQRVGLWVSGTSTTATLRDTVVRDTRSDEDGRAGKGLQAERGATLDAEGLLLERNANAGASGFCRGTQLSMRDTVVRDTRTISSGIRGRGVDAHHGAQVTLLRAVVANSHEVGVMAFGAGSTLTVRESLVRETQVAPGAMERSGIGALALGGGVVELERSLLTGNHDAGVAAYLVPSRVTLRRVLVVDTRSGPDGVGLGLVAIDGAALIANQVAVQGAVGAGVATISLTGGPTPMVEATDLFVRDVRPWAVSADGGLSEVGGYGLHLDRRGAMTLTRAVVAEARWGVVLIGDPLGTLSWTDGALAQLDHAGAWASAEQNLQSALRWTRVGVSDVRNPALRRDPNVRSLRH